MLQLFGKNLFLKILSGMCENSNFQQTSKFKKNVHATMCHYMYIHAYANAYACIGHGRDWVKPSGFRRFKENPAGDLGLLDPGFSNIAFLM